MPLTLARNYASGKPRILVTGATGFVGNALCRQLAAAGYPVRAATRAPVPGGIDVGRDVMPVGDIGPDTQWERALDSVLAIVHLAGRAHVLHEAEPDPLASYRRVNVAGTAALARAAVRSGVRRLVFASSVGVNGSRTRDVPFTPEDRPAPHNAYAQSKWEAEVALQQVARDTGLEVVVVRPPLVYGPQVKANFLRLLRAVHAGIPLPLGSVRNRRSLIGLDNLVSFLELAVVHPAAAGQTFLVADDEDISTPALIRQLASLMQRSSLLVPIPVGALQLIARVAGRRNLADQLFESLLVDSGKARRTIGWRAPVPLAEGLRRTVAWYQEHLGRGG